MPTNKDIEDVNCRIGSLENVQLIVGAHLRVNCRIGSLEIIVRVPDLALLVNCRIGSLEKERER